MNQSAAAVAVPSNPPATIADNRPQRSGAERIDLAFQAYQSLQQVIIKSMPKCRVQISGHWFYTKVYWSAIALASNITVELESEERYTMTGQSGQDVRVVEVVYRAVLPGGRSAVGDGACSSDEPKLCTDRDGNPRFVTVHDVRSRAQTRGYNRAISRLVAFGEVSFEEAEPGFQR